VDELDALNTRKQDILYYLFDWPVRSNSKLVMIAIGNTNDLPERMMNKRIISRAGFTRVSFPPYNYQELQKILKFQFKETDFSLDGMEFIARKVASISGDARKALDICNHSIKISKERNENSRKKSAYVTMEDVKQAFSEILSSPQMEAINNASQQQRTFLKAVICQFRLSGREEGAFAEIYQHHIDFCKQFELYIPSVSEVLEIAQSLQNLRLILIEPSNVDGLKRIRLNVSEDDVSFALNAN